METFIYFWIMNLIQLFNNIKPFVKLAQTLDTDGDGKMFD